MEFTPSKQLLLCIHKNYFERIETFQIDLYSYLSKEINLQINLFVQKLSILSVDTKNIYYKKTLFSKEFSILLRCWIIETD